MPAITPTTNTSFSTGQLVMVEPVSFTGTGAEYFRIWITNTFLSIVTLGIYSAWAKVRRTRYFYGNTRLAGASFDYHGEPKAILKGRAAALLLLIAYQVFSEMPGLLAGALALLLIAALPWLIWRSLQFKLYNTSYRGIRFGFGGSAASAYIAYLMWPVISSLTAFLLAPMAHQRIKRFQHGESRYGASRFSFDASVGRFYLLYLKAFLVFVAGGIVLGLLLGNLLAAFYRHSGAQTEAFRGALVFLAAFYVWAMLMYPVFSAMLQNLVWNHTSIGPHRVESRVALGRVAFIALTNLLAILCTLGLYMPFAKMRMMKYRLESVGLLVDGSLDDFVADAQAQAGATGEGVADLLDFDLSL
ncbi:YjgN family protein [Noviherbaspirillum soli]|uniref:YjgN family protein n=1 Tax=Noviherbaspirillum soli TaxID=1064518 RepID=UPI001E3EC134|nr:YjgN family protein [Noviherbaspirillum soli]